MLKRKIAGLFLMSGFALMLTISPLKAVELTVVPQLSDPDACQTERRDREACQAWYQLVENPEPDACLSARQNREKCDRWYHVAEAVAPRTTTGGVIKIDQMIHFDFDKATIKPNSYPILDDVASVIKTQKVKSVRIEGHTDSVGTDAYNEKLSQRRANAVRDYLVGKGIDSTKLEAIGYGESRPLADNATTEGRAKNRRTEFKVLE